MVKCGDKEYLRCIYCGYLNELDADWRNVNVSSQLKHCMVCENCHLGISIPIDAVFPKDKRLFRDIIG